MSYQSLIDGRKVNYACYVTMHLRTKNLTADTPPTSMKLALILSDIKELVDEAVNAALAKFSNKIRDIINSRFSAFESRLSRLVVIARDVRDM